MADTAKYDLRYPLGTDAPDVPLWIQRLAEDVDVKMSGYGQGAGTAARPAFGRNGFFWYDTLNEWLWLDIGTSWLRLLPAVQPHFKIRQNVNVAMAVNTWTTVPFPGTGLVELRDSYGHLVLGNNYVSIVEPGIYLVTANVFWNPEPDGESRIAYVTSYTAAEGIIHSPAIADGRNKPTNLGIWQSFSNLVELGDGDRLRIQLITGVNAGGTRTCAIQQLAFTRVSAL